MTPTEDATTATVGMTTRPSPATPAAQIIGRFGVSGTSAIASSSTPV